MEGEFHIIKTYSLQVVQGRLFGMGQSKANQWIHVLLPALQAALRTLGDTSARSLSALAQRLGISEADAGSLLESLEEEPPPAEPLSSTDVAGEASPCTIQEESRSGRLELDIGDPLARSASVPLHSECLKRTCTRAREPWDTSSRKMRFERLYRAE